MAWQEVSHIKDPFMKERESTGGEGNGNPLQHSCLRNPMDRGGWWATAYRVAKVGRVLATQQQEHPE